VLGTEPFDFYSLNWCDSSKGHTYDDSILKEKIVYGDTVNESVHESPYTYRVGESMDTAEVVCRKILSKTEVTQFTDMIWKRFRYQLFVDDLPNATMERNEKTGELEANYKQGNLLGEHTRDSAGANYLLYNHLSITVKTHHVAAGDELRIVGFEVEPKSIKLGGSLVVDSLDQQEPQWLKRHGKTVDLEDGILFSYSIRTVNDETTTWASRMDHYYSFGREDVHMRQILISLGIMLATTFLAFGYVKVSVTRDFALLHGGMTSSRQRRSVILRNDQDEARNLSL